MRISILAVALASFSAHAVTPIEPAPVSTSSAAASSATAEGGKAQAASSSRQSQEQAQRAEQALTYTDDSAYVSVALPEATADPGSTAACLESRRGWSFAGFGASGRTRTNAACEADRADAREFAQCLALAQALAALGRTSSAAAQLETCGAKLVDEKPDDTAERIRRAFEASQAK